MKLLEVTVNNFRNILDSNSVKIQEDITCLVGKNESGKTSFLHALYRLNPARPNVSFKVEEQYPAWLEKKDRRRGMNLDEFKPIVGKFEIDDNLISELQEHFGVNILTDNILIISRAYNGTLTYTLNTKSEEDATKELLENLTFSKETRTNLNKVKSVLEMKESAEKIKGKEENEKDNDSIAILLERINKLYGTDTFKKAIWEKIKPHVPKFIYFDRYSSLPYTVEVKHLLKSDPKELKDDELTALTLLRMAGADDDYLLNTDYERRKRELENVANALTEDVLNYWSQNRELRVSPDITLKTKTAGNGTTSVVDELKIRIWDNKHTLSLPFSEHSTGFQWFFSFLAAFSEYEYNEEPVIILLDEPGLGLHARAQADFLRFIEERLADKRQVIYSTHSPFMVQPNRLERARIVEEKDRQVGSKISQDALTTDSDTLFPLQGALGYDLVQHLFISENNLIVEGTSDFTYITILSDFLKENNRESLNEKWSFVPVGGADLIPTFVALLGNHLDVTVIVDSRKEGHQKLTKLAQAGYLKNQKIITIGEIVNKPLADIEDLFSVDDYLKLYNEAFGKTIKPIDVKGSDQIVNMIARFEGVNRFDHGKPADYFLRNKFNFLPNLSNDTLDNFENLIKRINQTFKT